MYLRLCMPNCFLLYLCARLLAVNKSLTDEAADILLERGLKDEGNGS